MKLVIVGGGGFRVPQVMSVVQPNDGLIDEVCLYDVDVARLDAMHAVLQDLGYADRVRMSATTDLSRALSGADFVFSAMRVGGTCGRVCDEREALSRGVLGQETVGVAGYAYAFRTIPRAMHLAERVAELAPQAWIINFTNPAGIITQAMRRVHPRVVGICDTPIGLVRRVGYLLGGPDVMNAVSQVDARISYDYAGLNHLGWLRNFVVDGVDRLPEILGHTQMLERLEEGRTIGAEWIQAVGAIPNEYLFFYYHNREITQKLARERTRGEFLHEQQGAFYQAVAQAKDGSGAGALWRAAHEEREATYMAESRAADEQRTEEDRLAGGYEQVAYDLMRALATGVPARMILGVPNTVGELTYPQPADQGAEVLASGINSQKNVSASTVQNSKMLPDRSVVCPREAVVAGDEVAEHSALQTQGRASATYPELLIPQLSADAVVEVPCVVDAAGVHPQRPRPLHGPELGLIQQVKACEELVIEAVDRRSKALAWRALAAHPTVDSVEVAHEILAGYLQVNPDIAEVFD
ncbi:6-phospho-beta-glucosidase [Trueperella sp. LYQ141]|uniref:family 4 glycosyl hydrolase n=1 Tax=Trueperella sp. LYQ141 TaxID=3391058 RepID=UPI003982ED60